ncbi:hypothetical protein [Actinoplanes rectilineatus]|uniref:hypothetical protein n=1 Tax=Actinoplanes rectilineatus TaxID=113571 RepID=UPI0005F278F6|nr:hypothetical protein [Actinoplanes rectilineatus]
MPTYTVVIEASNNDGTIWQALAPSETVEDDATAEDIAQWTASNQNIAEGNNWRVRVWNGADADIHTTPNAEYVAGEDDLIAELRMARLRIAELTDQRDNLIQQLMDTGVPRARIANAAGLREARLYQIRDGRR